MATNDVPLYDKNSFLFTNILEYSPENALQYCSGLLEKWTKDWSKDDGGKIGEKMRDFEKKRCLLLIWLSDKFGKKVDDVVEERKTYRLLSDKYDQLLLSDNIQGMIDEALVKNNCVDDALRKLLPSLVTTIGDSNAEKDRCSERQLQQHLVALLYLRQAAINKVPLSENLIKNAHTIVMRNLCSQEDVDIDAGQYRQCSVGSGITHTYPDFTSVPDAMQRIVREYSTKCDRRGHDIFELASCLLFEVLAVHPFVDGNGRLSRLLWCYSLIKDGLPFPVTPFPQKKRAYKTYIKCIQKDQYIASSRLVPRCSNLASLTLISVTRTWQNFIFNLRIESPESHKKVIEWIQEEKIGLK